MARVFCENCGRERRAVEAVGAYEGTPYCEPCRKADDISEEFFVRFGVQSSAPDAAPRSQVASPEAQMPEDEGFSAESLLSTAKRRCIDCGATLRLRRGKPARAQCRICEKKAKRAPIPAVASPKPFHGCVQVPDKPQKGMTTRRFVIKARYAKAAGSFKPEGLELLTDDAYQKLKPHAEHNDLARQLLAQIGMIVAVKGPKQGRLKLDAKKGDSRNLACRIRRLLRNEKIAAEVESFTKSSCVVVSVGYGKQAK